MVEGKVEMVIKFQEDGQRVEVGEVQVPAHWMDEDELRRRDTRSRRNSSKDAKE